MLGESFHITCNATNDQDAPMNLMFYWKGQDGVQFNVTTTDEDDNLTAVSTLHFSNVTHDHGGIYQCTVSNGENQENNISVASTLFIEGKILVHLLCTEILQYVLEQSSPPLNISITHTNFTSF